MRFILNIFAICAVIWGPSLYFGFSATREANKISSGEFCWFVRNPDAKATGFFVDWVDMNLTLEPSSPYHFWYFPSDSGLLGTRPYFGIVVPKAEFTEEFYTWSFASDSLILFDYDRVSFFGMNGYVNDCKKILSSKNDND